MKELLVKDYRILMTQKKVLFVLLCIMFFMICISDFDRSFLVGYMMMISVILSAGTVNFDEADNGMAFIMTLPATRRTYAIEKYVLTFINALFCDAVILVAFLISKGFVFWGMDTGKLCWVMFTCLEGMGLVAAVLLPLYLKYSVEKRRIAIAAVAGIAVVLFYIVGQMVNSAMTGKGLPLLRMLITNISTLNPLVLNACGVVAILACIAISMQISIKIMERKEF